MLTLFLLFVFLHESQGVNVKCQHWDPETPYPT